MKVVYIVHGWDGSPESGRVKRLSDRLHAEGIHVEALCMPYSDFPVVDEWISYLQNAVTQFGDDVIVVAHSIGVQAVLRRAETLAQDKKLGLLISVAGWFELVNLDDDVDAVKSWLDIEGVNRTKAASHFGEIKAIFSDDDQWVPVSNSLLFHEKLGSEIIMESGKGHFDWQDINKPYPSLLTMVSSYKPIDVIKKQSGDPLIRVLDRDGSELGSFHASKHESILDTAEKHNIDIGYSCRSGACFACACHVKQGFSMIDQGKFGFPLVDVDDGDCLTCISGLMDEAWGMEGNEIVIKKF